MKKVSKTIQIILLMAIGLVVLCHTMPGKRLFIENVPKNALAQKLLPPFIHKLNTKAVEAKQFAQKNNFNTKLCFLIDMSLPSYQKRIFIYNLQIDSIIKSGLVAHGNCNQYWLEGRKYDN